VITPNSQLVQAIGARLTGIIRTSPIHETIERIKAAKGTVLEEATARIDQAEGVRRAHALGFHHIAVSVAGFQSKTISGIRKLEGSTKLDVLIFCVCNTRVSKEDLKHIAMADVACASASKLLRAEIGKKAMFQLGVTIPVYALTEKGKRLVLAYLAESAEILVASRTSRLPYEADEKGPRLKDHPCHQKP